MCDPRQQIVQLLMKATTAAFYESYYFVYEMTSKANQKGQNLDRYQMTIYINKMLIFRSILNNEYLLIFQGGHFENSRHFVFQR